MSPAKIVFFLMYFAIVSESARLSIINGHAMEIKNIPYQLVLFWNKTFHCGASIISEKFAITAAHCTEEKTVNGITLRAGSTFRDNGASISVSKIIQHPKYNSLTFDFDFSLLRFKNVIKFGDNIKPVKLPKEGEIFKPGTSCIVSGWGSMGSLGFPKNLRAADVNIIDENKCILSYNLPDVQFNITAQMICAGEENPKSKDNNKDSCSGDSGGPLICNGVLTGVVSSGFGCGLEKFPGVYSKVSSVRGWIKDNAGV